ncbi:hypothetical protein AAFN47_04120 [Hoeflea sp. CAU 1731]
MSVIYRPNGREALQASQYVASPVPDSIIKEIKEDFNAKFSAVPISVRLKPQHAPM